jgi:diguanylate cyclase (GGDEF)-like protein/PAS domain S-box-containing protein
MKPALDICLNGLDILVVEDDATSAVLTSRVLIKYGARVETASNGQAGLDKFKQQRFPIIITDINMPCMNGLELVGRVKELDQSIQFIATSANRDTECLVSAIELGFSDYFLKPIEIEKLVLAVKRCGDVIAAHELLENERTKFQNVVESLGECLAIKSLDLNVVYQNPAMTATFGDLTGKPCFSMWKLTEPCDSCPTLLTMADGISHTASRDCEVDGKMVTVEATASPLKDARGNITGTIEIIRDISERARTERLIRNIARGISSKIGAEYLSSLTNYLTEALGMDFALVGKLSEDSRRIETLAFSRKGINCEHFSYDLDGTPCQQAINNGIQVFPSDVATLFPDDADLRTLSIQSYCGAPLIDSRGVTVGILCTFHTSPITQPGLVSDIISIFASRTGAEFERLKNEQIIRELAFNDPLTGLSNRRLFEDRLEQAIAKSRRYDMKFGLITLDLDHFKEVNDSLGHEAGDQVLIEAGERIRSCCKRDLDTISRYGGDEFCVIITDCGDTEQLENIARKLLEEFAKPLQVTGTEIRVTASIGVSMFPDGGFESKQLEIASDRAMYAAKKAGRNTYRLWIPYLEHPDAVD